MWVVVRTRAVVPRPPQAVWSVQAPRMPPGPSKMAQTSSRQFSEPRPQRQLRSAEFMCTSIC
eukprot:4595680-Alexandrium_andersonii.AAC.1